LLNINNVTDWRILEPGEILVRQEQLLAADKEPEAVA
jgi:hypothetical protein